MIHFPFLLLTNIKYNITMFIKTRKMDLNYKDNHAYYKLISWLTDNGHIDQFIKNTSVEKLHGLNTDKYEQYNTTTLLRIAFNFQDSPEGFDYWMKVTDELDKWWLTTYEI